MRMEIPTITKVMIEMVSMEILPLSAVVVRGEHEKRDSIASNKYPLGIFSNICVFIWFLVIYDQKIYHNFDF